MKISFSRNRLEQLQAEGCLLFFFEEDREFAAAPSPALRKQLRDWAQRTGWKARRSQVEILPTAPGSAAEFLVVAGLGRQNDFHAARLEQASAAAARAGRKLRLKQYALAASPFPGSARELPPAAALRLVLRGLGLGPYEFRKFKSSRSEKADAPLSVIISQDAPPSAELKRLAEETRVFAETMSEVRDVANLPGNEAFPEAIAAKVRGLARKYGVACKVLDEAALRREGCEALLAVARGSRRPPCVIRLTYPGQARTRAPVALVGKTITFDSGGISLKPGKGMEWMKFDKCGGMAVLATLLIAARLKIAQPLTAWMAVAENMPDGNATRPGDIVKARAGKTIEILNTDAEGRLILADALSLAAGQKPCAIVDLATLTGAVIIALGHAASGLMSNHAGLAVQLQQAGETAGDRVWPLPVWQEFEDDIQGQFADLKNIGDGSAGTIIGGVFLKQFVPAALPWAHIDIAGTAWLESAKRHASAGATLAGTRLLVEWLSHFDPHSLKKGPENT